MQIPKLEKLALYYGYPSLVNGSEGDVEKAIGVFSSYDSIVFGANLELKTHEDHEKAKEVIGSLMPKIHTFGYINLGVTTGHLEVKDIYNRITAWKKMKAYGIFLDSAGYDYGVSRKRQNDVIQRIHDESLSVFINAFNPADAFGEDRIAFNETDGGNPDGLKCLLNKKDYYLHESFQIQNGQFVDSAFWAEKCKKAITLSNPFGTHHMTTTATSKDTPFNPDQLNFAWWSALLWGFQGFSWGEKWFSSDGNLPFRERPSVSVGTSFKGDVVTDQQLFKRDTDLGTILVDPNNHQGSFTS